MTGWVPEKSQKERKKTQASRMKGGGGWPTVFARAKATDVV
jgi:hypothetical protein